MQEIERIKFSIVKLPQHSEEWADVGPFFNYFNFYKAKLQSTILLQFSLTV